jgi:L-lactate dehydrogenase (cytochrome)
MNHTSDPLPPIPLRKYAGKDATEEFEPIHPPGVIGDNLPEDKYIGPLDPNSMKETVHITAEKEQAGGEAESKQKPDLDASSPSSSQAQQRKETGNSQQLIKSEPTITQPADRSLLPNISSILSLHDFEHLANQVMSRKGWAYYSSGADDEITMRENTLAFQRIWFRPRVLRNVKTVDYSTTVLGTKTSMPIYIVSVVGHGSGVFGELMGVVLRFVW